LNDTDAAFELVSEFSGPGGCDHQARKPVRAWQPGLICSPPIAGRFRATRSARSAGLSRSIARSTPIRRPDIIRTFCEVIIAPQIEPEALEILKSKRKKSACWETGELPNPADQRMLIRSLSGGLLVQSSDNIQVEEDHLEIVTEREPTPQEIRDMLFAFPRVQACEIERDRIRQRRADDRDRRRANVAHRFKPHCGVESQRSRNDDSRFRRGLRCVLPLPRRAAGGSGCGGHGSHPAGRIDQGQKT
jgi:hypothetical protein